MLKKLNIVFVCGVVVFLFICALGGEFPNYDESSFAAGVVWICNDICHMDTFSNSGCLAKQIRRRVVAGGLDASKRAVDPHSAKGPCGTFKD